MSKKVYGKTDIHAAGVTFNNIQDKLYALKSKDADSNLGLRRIKRNPHDANCIEVLAYIPGRVFRVGYVPKNVSCWLAPLMDNGYNVRVVRQKRADGEKKPWVCGNRANGNNFGVQMRIVYEIPEEMLNKNKVKEPVKA